MIPALLIGAISLIIGGAAFYAPPSIGQMAVVFPFGTDQVTAYKIVLADGGSFVGGSKFQNIVIAYAPDAGFAHRVQASGALFTLAARGLCAPATELPRPI